MVLGFDGDRFHRYFTLLEICNSEYDNTDHLERNLGRCSNDSKLDLMLCSQMETLQRRSDLVGMGTNPTFNIRAQLFVLLKKKDQPFRYVLAK